MPTDPRIRIRLLAPLDSQGAGGSDPALPGGKPLALLVYLAHHSEGVPREELAALLWPGSPERRARGSLRQALWTLRQRYGDDLFASQDPVRLQPGRVTTDLQEVRALVEDGRLQDAMALWSVPPFRLFPDPGSREWKRWTEDIRDRLERWLGRALLEEGRRSVRRDGPGAALHWFEAALRVEPHRRDAHEVRIKTLLLLDRPGEAEGALAEAERDGSAYREGSADADGASPLSDPTWPELDLLREQVHSARRSMGSGEAGITDPTTRSPAGEVTSPPGPMDTPLRTAEDDGAVHTDGGGGAGSREGGPGQAGAREAGSQKRGAPGPGPRGAATDSGPGEHGTPSDRTAGSTAPDPGSPDSSHLPRAVSHVRDLPLIGRSGIRGKLFARWARAQSGSPQVVTLVGEPGSGKRRVVEEVERAAALDGATVVRVRGLRSGGDQPWTGLGRLVSRLIECPGAAGTSIASEQILRRLVPSRTNDPNLFAENWDSAPSPSPAGAVPTPIAVADALADLTGAIAEEETLLIVLEEFQRMDPASRDVLVLSLQELHRHPMMVVVTAAPALPGSALSLALNQLVGEERASAFHLERWEAADLAQLAKGVVMAPPPEALSRAGEGHPALTLAALESWLQTGGADDGSPPRLPSHIRDRWLGRWERLDLETRRIVGWVADAPEPLPVEAILTRDGDPPEEVRARIDRLLADGLLRLLPGLSLTPVHGELAEVILPRWEAEQAAVREAVARAEAAARAEATGDSGEDRTLVRRMTAVAGIMAAAILVLALLLPMGRAGSPAPPPFGGGTLFLIGQEEIVEVTPDHGPVAAWAERRFLPAVGSSHRRRLPIRSPEGEIHWIAYSTRPDEKPWVSLITGFGVEELYRTDGDDFPEALTPDGSRLLVLSQRMDLPEYQLDLYATPVAYGTMAGEARDGESLRSPVQEATGLIRHPRMSPDGRRIAFAMAGLGDTLVITTPTGERRQTRSFPRIHYQSWCGDSGDLFLIVSDDGPSRIYRYDPGEDRLERIPIPGPSGGTLGCSPDGSHLVYLGVVQGELLPILHSLEDHSWSPLPIPARSVSRIIWLPDQPATVAEGLEIEGVRVPLAWGEARRLQPRLLLSDGRNVPAGEVRWRSSNPSVASVTDTGLIFGNGLGTARITAVWDDWLTGSAEVEVGGEAGRGTLLQDAFADLDSLVWRQVGQPPARPVQRDGQSVLLLDGDALYWDGIITAQAWQFPRGLTAEVEFQLPLSRNDKQWFFLCLAEVSLPMSGSFERRDLPMRQEACFRYPSGSLSTFDPAKGTLEVAPGFPRMDMDLSPHLPTDNWTHAALQMRADGTLTLLVNRTPVATSPLRMRNGPDTEWRVMLLGSSWETEALVRDFTLWEEPRYPVDDTLGQ